MRAVISQLHYPSAIIWIFLLCLSLTSYYFSTLKCFPLSVPQVSPQYTSELGRHPVNSCRVYLLPTTGGIRIWCICNVSSSFLRTRKRSSCAVHLARPQAFHSTSILLDLHSRAYTSYFYVRNQWEKKILIKILALLDKSEGVQKK